MSSIQDISGTASPALPQYFGNSRSEMLNFLPENCSRVLEVGCGRGFFSASLDGVTDSWAVEPNRDVAVDARHRIGRVLEGTFEDVRGALPEHYFDLIICNDVIEHMIDHDRFFAQIRDYIAPGGCLIGSIPNVRHFSNFFELLFEKDWCYRKEGILDRTHLRFFTEKSLRRSLEKAGFNVERLQGINKNVSPGAGRDELYRRLATALAVLSFGFFGDIQYLQFGFRAVISGK